jgi:hypothetical protein
MSLRDIAAADIRTNIDAIGDSVTLTSPLGFVHSGVIGNVYRTEIVTDPDTGARINEPRLAVTIPLSSLPAGGISEAWQASVTDVTGAVVSGQVRSPMYDRTIGFVTFLLEVA